MTPAFRMSHMDLTVPRGTLRAHGAALAAFYADVLGFEAMDFPGAVPDFISQECVMLRTDPDFSQFILVYEHDQPLQVAALDHLGLHFQTAADVDAVLAKCRTWQQRDPRVEIVEREDIVLDYTVTHAFYMRFLLPIWFDIHHIAFSPDRKPAKNWGYV